MELKCIPRKESKKKVLPERISEDKEQLKQYRRESKLQGGQGRTLKALVLVYHGWELIHQEEENKGQANYE